MTPPEIFDDVCDRYLGRALRFVARKSARNKAHLLGYCLGGTLTTIHAALRPEHVASLLLLAAPVSFKDDGLLSRWTQSPTFEVGRIVEAFGNVPWQLMQGAFHLLRPTLTLSKAVTVLERVVNDEFMNGFLALETWGNDNVSFPGKAYERYIEELYRGDALMRGTFSMGGGPVRIENIDMPTLAIVFEHDNIVPWESAAALLERISSTDKSMMKLSGGHVGAVVSRAAQKNLWPKMSAFWAERDREPAALPVPTPAASLAKSGASGANGSSNGGGHGEKKPGARRPKRPKNKEARP